MTSSVTIVRSVLLNCLAIVPLLRAQLETLEEASEHGTVLMAARIPGNDRFTVPIRLRVSYPAPKTPRFGLTIAARTVPALYPRFRGDLELAGAGIAATKLTLSGEYHVPSGPLGRAFDAAVARGVSPRGLEDLLDRLIADVAADVAHESDAAYRAGRHGE
ncbi:MAG: hypothetical protein JWO85_1982 [Candidatus Eremiobacteraeota bacterium]|jgi:hypothetical protein|nr:hypothetical protein [Candidatus Eremiobacteraeota bacterium]